MAEQDLLLKKYGRAFPKGTILFKEGDAESKEMYVVHSGKVKIAKRVGDQETVLAIMGQGEFFGEMAILNNKPRSASAEVTEDAKLLVIDPKTFETMIKNNAEVAFRMIKKLSDRLGETDKKLELLMIKDNTSRVIHTLERLVETKGSQKEGGISIAVSTDELGSRSGVRIDHVQEILDKLKRADVIHVSNEDIFVSDVEKLKQFLEFLILKEKFGDLE
jgi:CRP-like cAMP-binding protein